MTASRPDLSYWTLVDIGRADVLDRARRVLDGAPDGARCLNQFKPLLEGKAAPEGVVEVHVDGVWVPAMNAKVTQAQLKAADKTVRELQAVLQGFFRLEVAKKGRQGTWIWCTKLPRSVEEAPAAAAAPAAPAAAAPPAAAAAAALLVGPVASPAAEPACGSEAAPAPAAGRRALAEVRNRPAHGEQQQEGKGKRQLCSPGVSSAVQCKRAKQQEGVGPPTQPASEQPAATAVLAAPAAPALQSAAVGQQRQPSSSLRLCR